MKTKFTSLTTNVVAAIIFFSYLLNSAHAQTSFSGEWSYTETDASSGKTYSTFDIRLTQNDQGELKGSYCFITQAGNRIDCDPDSGSININGKLSNDRDADSAEVHFYSFFGAQNGIAKLSMNGNDLVWDVIQKPRGDFFYGPYKVELKRVSVDNHRGEREVAIDRAYLYSAPSISSTTSTYAIKGDYVKLLNVSDDLKFWKIRYTRPNGTALEYWIDCNAIVSCP